MRECVPLKDYQDDHKINAMRLFNSNEQIDRLSKDAEVTSLLKLTRPNDISDLKTT